MSTKPKTTTGSLAGKLMLSGALILGSGAYAWWQNRPGTEMAALQPAPKQLAVIPKEMAASPPATPSFERPPDAAPAPAPEVATPSRPLQAAPPVTAVENTPPLDAVENAPPVQQVPPVALASSEPATPQPVPPPPQSSGRYANGDFTGPSTDTPWGTVQVVARIQNGAIAQVDPIDYPQHRRRSIQINEWAIPVLEREVIQAQNTDVDIVSQATTTSVGYLRSLGGALAQAKK